MRFDMKPEEYRRDQEIAGRRVMGNRTPSTGKKPFVAKGHDAFLKDAQDNSRSLRIVTMSNGDVHIGRMVARDKFTITIELIVKTENAVKTIRRTFFKHA